MHKKVTKRTREENKGETNTREVQRERSVWKKEKRKDARSNGDEDERRGKEGKERESSAGGSREKGTDAEGIDKERRKVEKDEQMDGASEPDRVAARLEKRGRSVRRMRAAWVYLRLSPSRGCPRTPPHLARFSHRADSRA